MPKIRPNAPTVAIAALIPVSIAVYAATTASATPTHVVDHPAAIARAHVALPHAYPPPPPPTSAAPTPTPTATATATATATTTATTTSTTSPTATSTATAPPTSPPPTTPPVTTPPVHVPTAHLGGHPHVKVHAHAFNPGQKVTIVLHGPHGFTLVFTRHAGPKGGLNKKIHIPADAPKGHYRVVTHGHHNGHKVLGSGDFKVKK